MNSGSSHGCANKPVSFERVGNALVGVLILALIALTLCHSRHWLWGLAIMAGNLIVTAIADRCPVKSLLIRLGMVGERDLGRAEGGGAAWRIPENGIRGRFLPNRPKRGRMAQKESAAQEEPGSGHWRAVPRLNA